MLNRLDRIQFAAPDAKPVVKTFRDLFRATEAVEDRVACLAARRWTLRMGESEIEILQPEGPGAVQEFVDARRSGLFAAGFSSLDMDDLRASMSAAGLLMHELGDQVFIDPTPVGGLRAVFTPERGLPAANRALLTHIYEVTNPVHDLKAAVAFYSRAFGLDPTRFAPISSTLYAYHGALTLFDPPARLDRIEVTQTYNSALAMGRFFEKYGESLYMCFAEVNDFAALRDSLDRCGVRYTLRDARDFGGEPNVLFIHPQSLHGMLMGVSQIGVAWEWSSAASGASHG